MKYAINLTQGRLRISRAGGKASTVGTSLTHVCPSTVSRFWYSNSLQEGTCLLCCSHSYGMPSLGSGGLAPRKICLKQTAHNVWHCPSQDRRGGIWYELEDVLTKNNVAKSENIMSVWERVRYEGHSLPLAPFEEGRGVAGPPAHLRKRPWFGHLLITFHLIFCQTCVESRDPKRSAQDNHITEDVQGGRNCLYHHFGGEKTLFSYLNL